MKTPSFSKILETQFRNFETSKSNFEDILTWAERVKEYVSSDNILLEIPGPMEYLFLTHQCGNAFITSVLTLMKAHIFFAEAVARIGLEATMQMAVIEANFDEHLDVWKRYNYFKKTKKNWEESSEWKEIKKKYQKVFSYERANHDYSSFMSGHEKEQLFDWWKLMSNTGSHAGFIHSTMSIEFGREGMKETLQSGIFDIVPTEPTKIGVSLVWLTDVYFILAAINSRILIGHNFSLRYNPDRIEDSYQEWCDFKQKKANDFGIKKPD